MKTFLIVNLLAAWVFSASYYYINTQYRRLVTDSAVLREVLEERLKMEKANALVFEQLYNECEKNQEKRNVRCNQRPCI